MLGAYLVIGCAYSRIGSTPEQICGRDNMIFSGRTYGDQQVTTNDSLRLYSSSQGISCTRPTTKIEECSVIAARGSDEFKEEICVLYNHGNCEDGLTKKDAKIVLNSSIDRYNELFDTCRNKMATQ